MSESAGGAAAARAAGAGTDVEGTTLGGASGIVGTVDVRMDVDAGGTVVDGSVVVAVAVVGTAVVAMAVVGTTVDGEVVEGTTVDDVVSDGVAAGAMGTVVVAGVGVVVV